MYSVVLTDTICLPASTVFLDDHHNSHQMDQHSTPLLAIHYTMRRTKRRSVQSKSASCCISGNARPFPNAGWARHCYRSVCFCLRLSSVCPMSVLKRDASRRELYISRRLWRGHIAKTLGSRQNVRIAIRTATPQEFLS